MEIMHRGMNFGLRMMITGNRRKYHMGSKTFFDEVVVGQSILTKNNKLTNQMVPL